MINDGTKIERKNGTAKQIDLRFRRLLRFSVGEVKKNACIVRGMQAEECHVIVIRCYSD
jgi:hypothetical protein